MIWELPTRRESESNFPDKLQRLSLSLPKSMTCCVCVSPITSPLQTEEEAGGRGMVAEGGEAVVMNQVEGREGPYYLKVFPHVNAKNCCEQQRMWRPSTTCGMWNTAPAGTMGPFLGLPVCSKELHVFGVGFIGEHRDSSFMGCCCFFLSLGRESMLCALAWVWAQCCLF